MMDGTDESLPEACEQALQYQALVLAGEVASAEEEVKLAAHLAACETCRRLKADMAEADGMLRCALSEARVSPGFVARTMAALPEAVVVADGQSPNRGSLLSVASGQAPRVFLASRRRWTWVRAGVAAAVAAAGVLLVWAAATGTFTSSRADSAALVVTKGRVLSANGQPVRELKLEEVYKVQETAVLPLAKAGSLRLQPGAEFRLQSSGSHGDPHLRLKSGDLYVWGKDDQRPIRVEVTNFEAVLHKGDFFVAEEAADSPAGVVIVFAGRAQVAFEKETMPLQAGQVFLSLGSGDWAVTQTLELAEAVEHLAEGPAAGQDLVLLRREYEDRVRGYRQELKVLEEQVGKELDARRQAELRERYQRVLAYLGAHQRRLDSMLQSSPYDAIRRGLEGHTDDPAQWM